MTEKEAFEGVEYKKKFAFIPVKERLNVYNQGGFIWLTHYFEWEVPHYGKFKERCSYFKFDKGE